MSQQHQRPGRFAWPPVIYVGAIAATIIVHWLLPAPWITGPFSEFLFGLGCLIAAGALAIVITAIRALRRAGTTVMPNRRSDHLVTKGPYSFTRNPIYLGNTMLMMALALIFGVAWFFVFALLAAFLTGRIAIAAEEKHLDLRFGRAWRDYAKRVRRWI